MIEATWIGGPYDGQMVAIYESTADRLNMAIHHEPSLDEVVIVSESFREVVFPIVRTRNGYRIIWREP